MDDSHTNYLVISCTDKNHRKIWIRRFFSQILSKYSHFEKKNRFVLSFSYDFCQCRILDDKQDWMGECQLLQNVKKTWGYVTNYNIIVSIPRQKIEQLLRAIRLVNMKMVSNYNYCVQMHNYNFYAQLL